jgi:hypothetical protein
MSKDSAALPQRNSIARAIFVALSSFAGEVWELSTLRGAAFGGGRLGPHFSFTRSLTRLRSGISSGPAFP